VGFSNQERINANSKALQASVLDANPSAVWYETFFPWTTAIDAAQTWTEMERLRALPAANLATAQTNSTNNPDLIQDKSAVADAVRLTLVAGTNYSTYAAYSTYNDTASAVFRNWLQPQLVPRSTGAPSNGYAVQLYDGDPDAGGTLITTSAGTTGTGEDKTVGWIFNYATGLLLVSVDFFSETGITAANFDPYINGFRYVGKTGVESDSTFTGTAGEALTAGDVVRFDQSGTGTAGQILKAQGNSPTNADVVGIALGSAAINAPVSIYLDGKAPVSFQSAPPATSNGLRVYLDPSNVGKATTTLPSASGNVIVLIGRLIGGDGSDTTPTVILSTRQIAVLG